MLCAWRRQPSVAGVRLAEQMAGQKELWTFWYGDEPATLQEIKANAMFGKSDYWYLFDLLVSRLIGWLGIRKTSGQ